MKPVLLEDSTHEALKAYCETKGIKIYAAATKFIAERLLEEAGGKRDNPT